MNDMSYADIVSCSMLDDIKDFDIGWLKLITVVAWMAGSLVLVRIDLIVVEED